MSTERDWSQASDEEIFAAAAQVTDYTDEAQFILSEARRRRDPETPKKRQEGVGSQENESEVQIEAKRSAHYWNLGLLLLFFNGYLSALAATPRVPGDPFVLRLIEVVNQIWTANPEAIGAASVPYLLAFIAIGIAMVFRRARDKRTSSIVLLVVMVLFFVGNLFSIVLVELASRAT